jgi:hypothetical protein
MLRRGAAGIVPLQQALAAQALGVGAAAAVTAAVLDLRKHLSQRCRMRLECGFGGGGTEGRALKDELRLKGRVELSATLHGVLACNAVLCWPEGRGCSGAGMVVLVAAAWSLWMRNARRRKQLRAMIERGIGARARSIGPVWCIRCCTSWRKW